MKGCAKQMCIVIALVSTTALTACATGPDPMKPVRDRMAAARADSEIRTYAVGSLSDAQRTLARAAEADEDAVRDHLIYMTGKHLDIAEAIVERHQAEVALTQARRQEASIPDSDPTRKVERLVVEQQPIDKIEPQMGKAGPPPNRKKNDKATSMEEMVATLKSTDGPPSVSLTVPDLFFESGATELSPGAKRRLEPLVSSLRAQPELDLLVEGHTDDSGEREENLRVSLARAQAVKDYLVGQGISSNRIRTIGLGERYPIASNDTHSGRQRNRRIELVLHRTGTSSEQKARRP